LYDSINDLLTEKRKVDKYNMELDEKIQDKNLSDFEKR